MKIEPTTERFVINSASNIAYQIVTEYDNLVQLFGEPNGQGDAEWDLKINGQDLVKIFNFKNGKKYKGPDSWIVKHIIRWNIAALDPESATLLKDYILDSEKQRNDTLSKTVAPPSGFARGGVS